MSTRGVTMNPAGQVTDSRSTTPTIPANPPTVDVGPDGRIQGIDGMLDQISEAVMRQARREILPEIQRDKSMQREVGKAIGNAAALQLNTPVTVASLALAAIAGVLVVRTWWMWREKKHSPAKIVRNKRK